MTVEVTSEAELMDFYKGLHQVGVRLLTENAGEGGRANLQHFSDLYFSNNEQVALKHLRMSLFADPFNDDSKAVAAQLESTDLFGLLSSPMSSEGVRRITIGVDESLPDVSERVYGNRHYGVLLQRYNAQFNSDYQESRLLYVPDLNQLPVLGHYHQPSTNTRRTSPPAVRANSTSRQITQRQPEIASATSSDPVEAQVREETSQSSDQTISLEPAPQPLTPQQLHQRGQSEAAYRVLRAQPDSERDQQLFEHLRETLVEVSYREGVSHFHAQEVRDAIEKFQQVLNIEPEHQRARQYMERAARLDARLSDIES
ncbi:hypothetical protein [Nitrincola sp. MINF-07-Sa-05]|uniref:hypothetical protein n=1 Tax=Nitrincola salilacus TaxID=3400273 RepID=UPI003917FDEB